MQYPKPTCTNIDFSQVPNLTELPFKNPCGPLPPVFNARSPETYYGFAAACTGAYKDGYFVINTLDSGKVLEGGFDGTQKSAPIGINHAGTYTVNDYVIRVEHALVIPGSYETSMQPADKGFIGYGQPALIQKIYLNSVDPMIEINKLPADAIPIALELLQNSKEPDALWIASPLPINITKPATVVEISDRTKDSVKIALQLDMIGEQTVEIYARKTGESCLAVGTRGLATLQSDLITECVGDNVATPAWLFLPLDAAQSILVKNTATVEQNEVAQFNVFSGDETSTVQQEARALSKFNCPGQLGIAFLQECEWVAVPYNTIQLTASVRAVTTDKSSNNLVRIKYVLAGETEEKETLVLRGDVAEGQDYITCLPSGTPGLVMSSPGDNCEGDITRFYPFNVVNTLLVKAKDNYENVTEGLFEIYNGEDAAFICPDSAEGFPYCEIPASLPANTIMCAGDLGILSLGNDCNFTVNPLAQAELLSVFPAITKEDTSTNVVPVDLYRYNKVTDVEDVEAVVANRGDLDQINDGSTCVVPFLPKGTKGLVKVFASCANGKKYVFYPMEKTSFFIGSLSGECGIGFKDECLAFTAVSDSVCNTESAVDAGFARTQVRLLDDMLCSNAKALVYRDTENGTCSEWVARPLLNVNALNFAAKITKTFNAIANEDKPNCTTGDKISILYYNKNIGGWKAPVCNGTDKVDAVCNGCVPKGTAGIYTVTIDSGKAKLQRIRDMLKSYGIDLAPNATEEDVRAALKQLACAGVYPMCEDFVHEDTDGSDDELCGVFTPLAAQPLTTAIAKDNYSTPGEVVELELLNVVDPLTGHGVKVNVKINFPIESGQVLLIKINNDCSWETINPEAKDIVVVDANACLRADNATEIEVVPNRDIANQTYTIRVGQKIVVPLTNSDFNKFPDDLCVPKHCGGTALFNRATSEWYYLPPAQVLNVSTYIVSAKAKTCNKEPVVNESGDKVDTIDVEYEIVNGEGQTELVVETVECAIRMIPAGTPGQLQKTIKTLCTGEKIPKAFFLPFIRGSIPIVATENVARGEKKNFNIDQNIYGELPTGMAPVILVRAKDDFCVGDTGIAVIEDCDWAGTRNNVGTRITISQGKITGILTATSTENGDETPTSTVDEFCKLFTKLENHDPNTNSGTLSPDNIVKIGQKISVSLYLRDKDCVDNSNSIPDVIEAYALAPSFIGENCLVWPVRINCTNYWLAAPIQTYPTITTIVTFDQPCLQNTDCCGASIDAQFKNPFGGPGRRICFNSIGFGVSAGSNAIASLTPVSNGFRWVALPMPPLEIYAKVCWGVDQAVVVNNDLPNKYYPAILVDSSGQPTTDPPTKVGVRMGGIRPTRVGNKAVYKVRKDNSKVSTNQGNNPNFDEYYFLEEDAKSGMYPHGYKEGEVVQNAPSKEYVVGAPIDRKKNYLRVDALEDDCEKMGLCFITNFYWSTDGQCNWLWGKVSQILGQETEEVDAKYLAAHEVLPYGSLVQLNSTPITDPQLIGDILAGNVKTVAIWAHPDSGSTYAEKIEKEIFT